MMHQPKGLYERFIKRLLDFILSLGALLVLSPLLLALSALGLVKMKGNPFFSQERPGWHEKIFRLYKFRTMTNEKDKNGELLPDEKRLIPYGRFLRSTSLDELPELWNILKGDMSIIGPRPLLVKYLPFYTEEERKRHNVRPGLTGLAQIHGRNYLKPHSMAAVFYQATSKFWISTVRLPLYMKKREGQIYFQTWHGAVNMKRIEGECIEALTARYLLMAKHDSKMIDYIVASNRDNYELFRDYFWLRSGEILPIGSPRNDIFFNDSTNEQSTREIRAGILQVI